MTAPQSPAAGGGTSGPSPRGRVGLVGCLGMIALGLAVIAGAVVAINHLVSTAGKAVEEGVRDIARAPAEAIDALCDNLSQFVKVNVEVRTTIAGTISSVKQESKLVVLTAATGAEVKEEHAVRMLGERLGKTVATVRVPGKVQYYVPLGEFGGADIRVEEAKRRVIVTVPQPVLDTELVEVEWTKMAVETKEGWLRFNGKELEEKAKARLRSAVIEAAGAETVRAEARQGARACLGRLLAPLAESLKPGVVLEVEFSQGDPQAASP